jgi:hypothetical protein
MNIKITTDEINPAFTNKSLENRFLVQCILSPPPKPIQMPFEKFSRCPHGFEARKESHMETHTVKWLY